MSTVVLEIDTDPLSLDPTFCQDYIGQMIIQALYEPLYVRDEQTQALILGAAVRHEVSEDGLVHHFDLDADRKWSDGTPVTAQDYVFSFRRLLSPERPNAFQGLFTCLLHAEEILEQTRPVEDLGVFAVEDHRLCIRLAYTLPFFQALLAMPCTSPLPKVYQAEAEGTVQPQPTVTNGPYVLQAYRSGESVRLLPNQYYGKEAEGAPELFFRVNGEMERTLSDFEANRVHVTCNTYFPFDRLEEMAGRPAFQKLPSGIEFFLRFNRARHDRFRKKEIRRALYAALDKQKIEEQLQHGVCAWNHFVTRGIVLDRWGNEDFVQEEARRSARDVWELEKGALAEAVLTVLYAEFYPNREILELMAAMWEEQLGLTVRLEGVPFSEFVERMQADEYDLCLCLVSPTFSDPFCYLQYFLADLEEEAEGPVLEALEQALNQDGAESWTFYEQADRLLQEELPALPLFNGYSLYLQHPQVAGYHLFPDGSASFRQLRLEGER